MEIPTPPLLTRLQLCTSKSASHRWMPSCAPSRTSHESTWAVLVATNSPTPADPRMRVLSRVLLYPLMNTAGPELQVESTRERLIREYADQRYTADAFCRNTALSMTTAWLPPASTATPNA